MRTAEAKGNSELTTLARCLGGWAVFYLCTVFTGSFGWQILSYAFYYPIPVGALLVAISYAYVCKRHPKQYVLNLLLALLAFSLSWPLLLFVVFVLAA